MKPERRLRMTKIKGFLTAAVFLFGVLSLSGCVTNKVLELRRDRETRINAATNFWTLAAVRSGYIVAGNDVSACVEFRDSPADAPQAFTINLSQASRIGRTFAGFMPAGYDRIESPHGTEAQADLVWHLYPLQEAQKGCDKAASENPFPVSELKIEALQLRREDLPRLLGMLHSPDGGVANEGKLIEVSFAHDDQEAEPATAKDVLLVYQPPAKSAELVQPIGVAGAFEPVSEWVNPYTLLVAPAVAADAVIITTILMIYSARYR